MTVWFRVTARDSLFFRANLNFGEAGEWGGGVMPPAPSVLAGAFRSAILASDPTCLDAFVRTGRCGDAALETVLGVMPEPASRAGSEPLEPGTFRLAWSSLARFADGHTEPLIPMPRDLATFAATANDAEETPSIVMLHPMQPPSGVKSSGSLPTRAVLRTSRSDKPIEGRWLLPAAQVAWLDGHAPSWDDTLCSRVIFRPDPRLGIGLDSGSRTVAEGLLYTTDGQGLVDDGIWQTGFLVGLEGLGSAADLLGREGLLRLGGDGRAARYERLDGFVAPVGSGPERLAADGRFRLILRTPALAAGGWLPPLVASRNGGYVLEGPGGAFRARLACASTGRPEVLGGWDLHAWRPKPAQRAVAAGSVFWFDEFEGDAAKLSVWVDSGMPGDPEEQHSRRAEGYGQAFLGRWQALD